METLLDIILATALITIFIRLGSSRLGHSIRVAAIQGIAIGLIPLFTHSDPGMRAYFVCGAGILLKGAVFPWLLTRALREGGVRREIEPYIGYTKSLLCGLLMLAFSLWINSRLQLPEEMAWPPALLLAFFNIFAGLFLIVSRKKALTQVLGYLVVENGIHAFGAAFAFETPFLVEMGMLLDVFMAVFVLGIAMFHINREFDHIDMHRLDALSDWPSQKAVEETGS